ncbi:MAG: ECF-type sigma factor [Planctomycetota bacterium]
MPEPSESDGEVTRLLRDASSGKHEASSLLYVAVERQLRAMAGKRLRNERPDAEVQETVLVNDAFMNLVGSGKGIEWSNRKQFFVLAARNMRQMLVDTARRRGAQKRGGPDSRRADLDIEQLLAAGPSAAGDELLDIHEALEQLAESEPRKAEFVEMRYFGGYTIREIAELSAVSESLVKQDLTAARRLLRKLLELP